MLEKLLSFFRYQEGKDKIWKSPDLNCDVPWSSAVPLTLFTPYTNDMTPQVHGANLAYSDDTTQIVGYPGKSQETA